MPTLQLVKRSALPVPFELSGSWLLLAVLWELHVELGDPPAPVTCELLGVEYQRFTE